MNGEEKYNLEGDDSSDEENEKIICRTPVTINNYYTEDLISTNLDALSNEPSTSAQAIANITRNNTEGNLNVSLLFQDLGLRILASKEVRELYFPTKRNITTNIGMFENLPIKQN